MLAGTLVLMTRVLGPSSYGAYVSAATLAVLMGLLSRVGAGYIVMIRVAGGYGSPGEFWRYAWPLTSLVGSGLALVYYLLATGLVGTSIALGDRPHRGLGTGCDTAYSHAGLHVPGNPSRTDGPASSDDPDHLSLRCVRHMSSDTCRALDPPLHCWPGHRDMACLLHGGCRSKSCPCPALGAKATNEARVADGNRLCSHEYRGGQSGRGR